MVGDINPSIHKLKNVMYEKQISQYFNGLLHRVTICL